MPQLTRPGEDEGTTMAEIVAGMAIMTIFLAIFTGAMTNIFRTVNHAEGLTVTSAQLNTAFVKLDKQVRYAAALSTPTTAANAAGNYYAEFQTSNTGSFVCTQLQLNVNTRILKERTWTVPSAGAYSNLTAFVPIASQVLAQGTTPFLMTPFSATVDFEQLTVNLQSTMDNSTTGSDQSVTYIALNSSGASSQNRDRNPSLPSLSDSVCQEAGRP